MKKVQRTIQFEPNTLEQLLVIAGKESRSLSSLVNFICKKYVEEQESAEPCMSNVWKTVNESN